MPAYEGQCFGVNNFLLSKNSYVPLLELSKWIYVRFCHNALTGENSNSSVWNPVFSEEKPNYLDHTLKVWELSSNKVYDFATQREIPYLHFIQPNQYLVGSKILSELEKTKFLSYEPYKEPIERYYKHLEINKLKTPTKYDHRYLFIDDNRTVYSDVCCHFNLIGMEKITNSIIKDASNVFEGLLRKKATSTE